MKPYLADKEEFDAILSYMGNHGYTLKVNPETKACSLLPHPNFKEMSLKDLQPNWYQIRSAIGRHLRQLTPNTVENGSAVYCGFLDLGYPNDGSEYYKLYY